MKAELILCLASILLLSVGSGAQGTKTKPQTKSSMPEYVVIGSQTWTTGNLNTDKFRNGDPIPEAKSEEEWMAAGERKQPAWCYYKNDGTRGARYGKLYNWYAVSDPRGLAPVGWHVPGAGEWETLITEAGGLVTAGTTLRGRETGFNGIAGSCRYSFGSFNDDIGSSYWWTNSSSGTGATAYRIDSRGQLSNEVFVGGDGLSVRCVKN
jgi:uncharacterized protein (TIGR02145 family)